MMTLALTDPAPEALSPSDHYERLYWLTRIADGDTTALAEDVVSRIRLGSEDDGLLRMAPPDQRAVERFLGAIASRRLAAMPLDQLTYARTVGHPVDGARAAFEHGGEPLLAAAYYALVHDKLAAAGNADGLDRARAALRFAVARALVAANSEKDEACRDLVRRTLDTLAADGDDDQTLRGAMSAWLEGDGDGPLSLVGS